MARQASLPNSLRGVAVMSNNVPLPSTSRPDWKSLYKAAILESDKKVVPQRVSEAEKAVIARRREIFYGNGSLDEKECLEDALYALQAFRTAWQHTEAA